MDNDPVRGRTIAWSYADGPMKGARFEHTFHADGTVSWRMLGEKPAASAERPKYEVAELGGSVCISYLAPSGWTLTSVLDMGTKRMVSFASNEKELVVQHGTFELPRD